MRRGSCTVEILGEGWAVIPPRSSVQFIVLFVAVHLGRRLSGKHDPGSRRRVALRPVPPAQCPLGPHFPVSPTPALGPKRALFSGSLFHLAERDEEPPPSSPSFPGGRAGRSGEVFEGPGGQVGPEEAPGRLCDRPGLSSSLLRRRGASSPAPAFPGRAGRGEEKLPASAPAAPAAEPRPSEGGSGQGPSSGRRGRGGRRRGRAALGVPSRAPRPPLPGLPGGALRWRGGRRGGGRRSGAAGGAGRAGGGRAGGGGVAASSPWERRSYFQPRAVPVAPCQGARVLQDSGNLLRPGT